MSTVTPGPALSASVAPAGPIGALLASYPILSHFELQLYQKLFHPMVKRSSLKITAPYLSVFEIPFTAR